MLWLIINVLKGVCNEVNVKFCLVEFIFCLVLFKVVWVVFSCGLCSINVDKGLLLSFECVYLFFVWIFCNCFFFRFIIVVW